MKKMIFAFAVIVSIIAAIYGLYCYLYPYGRDHRCNTLLFLELCEYADKHGGTFPAGEATPEASLSLIRTVEPRCGYLLRRRDVSKEFVDDKLQRGELLGPETCGWNYVEGLRRNSNPELALFWDKEGLNEMGGRLQGGGHWVTFVCGETKTIAESEWDDFMANQKKLLTEEMAKRQTK
jgi:hypothetical protein